MTYPNWYKPHDPYYDQYSVEIADFSMPAHFDIFIPDDGSEVGCKTIVMPSPRRGAVNYTKNNKFMIIGIYSDTGREPTIFPIVAGKTWSTSGSELTIFDSTNKVRVGDYLYCYNTNVSGQQYLKCIARQQNFFTLKLASLMGPSTGTSCSYRIDRVKNFAEENIVFRLFPTFKLITYSEFLNIAQQTAPNSIYRTSKVIKNLTSGELVRAPLEVTSDTDYTDVNNYKKVSEVSYSTFKLNVEVKGNKLPEFENNQTFDYNGQPLRLKYDEAGRVIDPNFYDSKYKNNNVYVGSQISNEVPSNDPSIDDRIWCYDFYGIDINDPSRGPYNVDNVITRNTDIQGNVNNISRLEVNGIPLYPTSQYVYDRFGNIAIGVNHNNTLNVIRQRIPIQLDNFGRPLKLPY